MNLKTLFNFFKCHFLIPKCANSPISYTTTFRHLLPPPSMNICCFLLTFILLIPTFTKFYELPPILTFVILLPGLVTFYHPPVTFTTFHQFLSVFILLLLLATKFVILMLLRKISVGKIYLHFL